MSPEDSRLVAALTLLRDKLAPVVDDLLFGEVSPADRRVLARALRRVADTLEPEPVVLVPLEADSASKEPPEPGRIVRGLRSDLEH